MNIIIMILLVVFVFEFVKLIIDFVDLMPWDVKEKTTDYKYKMTTHCRFCGKKYEYHSNWFPCEVMMGWLNIILLFHVAVHHPTELTSRRIWYQLKEIIKGLIVIIIYGFLGILKIIFYPIYWILDNFLY